MRMGLALCLCPPQRFVKLIVEASRFAAAEPLTRLISLTCASGDTRNGGSTACPCRPAASIAISDRGRGTHTLLRYNNGERRPLSGARRGAQSAKKAPLKRAFESSCSISSASGSFGEPTRHDQVGAVRVPSITFVNSLKKKRPGKMQGKSGDSQVNSSLMNDQRLQLCHA